MQFPTGGKVREPMRQNRCNYGTDSHSLDERRAMKQNIFLLGILVSAPLVHAGSVCVAEPSGSNSLSSAARDTTVTLQEVAVRANFANEQETPLNLTTITPHDFRIHATAPNYVEVMQGVPGVYATSSAGNYGDAQLNIRGFKQDNVAVMLNGIPIQGLTSGSMYWSNWMGLADATYAIQVQKGMGSSMLADCAMGGMVNIITKTSAAAPMGEVSASVTEHGLTKTALSYSTGQLSGGWSANALVSYTRGGTFVECSDVSTLSYLLSVSKRFTDRHTLIFTAMGSPETHDQRNTELSAAEVEAHGRGYSKNWGYLRGKPYSIARNHYFKPYFTLQHLLEGERFSMKNSLYLALASGGGRSTVSAGGANIISHQTATGHIDFDAILRENTTNTDADGALVGQSAMIDFLAGHKQAGAIASGEYRLTDAVTLLGGVQYQYFDTWQKMKMLDLLGADYLLYYGAPYRLGDYIGSRYGRTTHHASAYAQVKYVADRWNLHLGASVFNGNYRRHNDLTGAVSRWATGWGVSVKGGALYHLIGAAPHRGSGTLSVFANAGFNSRLPYAGVYLASSDLSVTNDVTNEKNLLGEMGVRSTWSGGGLELSAYLASWRNKTLTANIAKRANEAAENFQITGLNALHKGIELSAHQRLFGWLRVKAYAMLASWKWKSGGKGITYDSYSGSTLKQYAVYCNNLHVGDAPQTQYGAELHATIPLKGLFKRGSGKTDNLYASLSWNANANMYADFEPSSRTTEGEGDAYKLPSYHLVDATVGWNTTLSGKVMMNLFVSCTNLFDAHYIQRGIDGQTHDLASFRGYWGAPRLWSFGLKLSFR